MQLLTICDACNSWPEFGLMLNMTTKHAAQQFDQSWFCHYTCSEVVIYDNGTEFIGCNFQEPLKVTALNVS